MAVKKVKEYNEDTPIKISLECIEDILELLKDKEEVVRCKDCKHRNTIFCFKDEQGFGTDDDWYCADGERRTDDA